MSRSLLLSELRALAVASEHLWQLYCKQGPGNVPPAALAAWSHQFDTTLGHFAKSPGALSQEPAALWQTILSSCQLLRRAAERPEGLCFVTGEAGLIPRRDDYARCQQLPKMLVDLATLLETTAEES